MDGRDDDHGLTTGEQPLTRRALRAAARAQEQAHEQAHGQQVQAHEQAPGLERAQMLEQAHEQPTGPGAVDSWDAAVGWSLRGELPATLPPEPVEPDDVTWEPLPGTATATATAGEATLEPVVEPVVDLPHGATGGRAEHPDEHPAEHQIEDSDEHRIEDSGELDPDLVITRPRPAEPAEDRRPWAGGSGLWGEDVRVADRADDTRPIAPIAPLGSLGGAVPALPASVARGSWTPTTSVPTQPGEPIVPPDAVGALGPIDPGAIDPGQIDPGQIDVSGAAAVPTPARPHPLPTLDDLIATRPAPAEGPAEWGWRAVVRRVSAGLVSPQPGPAERAERAAVAGVQRPLDGPRTVVVINPKGGAHKTTATLLLAATFGRLRGGYTLAWDNNETRGTLGWRSRHTHHTRTAVDLLEDLERFADPRSSRVGDLDAYVRAQASGQFDVLASDEDAASAASIDGFAFRALHRTLLRFYRVLVVDTGNNMRASNWQAAIDAADQVVVVSTMREDTAQSAAWALDALRATGHEDVVRRAVTVLSQPAPKIDKELTARLHDHFGRLTREVLEVPYEPALVSGGPIDLDALSDATRHAWLRVAAAVADGL